MVEQVLAGQGAHEVVVAGEVRGREGCHLSVARATAVAVARARCSGVAGSMRAAAVSTSGSVEVVARARISPAAAGSPLMSWRTRVSTVVRGHGGSVAGGAGAALTGG